jgi:hypothetical protein
MVGDIFLYQVAKYRGSEPQCLSQRLDVQFLRMEIKSDHGIFVLGGHLREAEDLTSLSTNSFPAIPVWPGTHMN